MKNRNAVGGNAPPVEILHEDAALLLAMLERDMGQALTLLTMPAISEESQHEVVAMMEKMRPVRNRLRKAIAQHG